MELEIFDWIQKIIATCAHDFHFEAVDKLIMLYQQRFDNEKNVVELKKMRQDKWNEIHVILN